jgi:hypothetical protein
MKMESLSMKATSVAGTGNTFTPLFPYPYNNGIRVMRHGARLLRAPLEISAVTGLSISSNSLNSLNSSNSLRILRNLRKLRNLRNANKNKADKVK